MEELNAKLELERDRLESRVRERTAELAASEARFRSFTSLGSDWYWEQDAQFRFTSIAGNTEVYPGHTIGSHIGRTRWDIDDYDAPAGGWDEHRRLLAVAPAVPRGRVPAQAAERGACLRVGLRPADVR